MARVLRAFHPAASGPLVLCLRRLVAAPSRSSSGVSTASSHRPPRGSVAGPRGNVGRGVGPDRPVLGPACVRIRPLGHNGRGPPRAVAPFERTKGLQPRGEASGVRHGCLGRGRWPGKRGRMELEMKGTAREEQKQVANHSSTPRQRLTSTRRDQASVGRTIWERTPP